MSLLEIEASNPVYIPKEWNQLEFNGHPAAPLAFAKDEFLILK